MDDPTAPGSVHDLLLRLAGRVEDDLLADARELVGIGEDGHALELVTAALAAQRTSLPMPVRTELVAAAHDARIDMDADAALAPPTSDVLDHRFTARGPEAPEVSETAVRAAVRQLPERLRTTGTRLRLTWRSTPAGSAPTPPPYAVLLVETQAGGRPGEVLAHQLHEALRRFGVDVAVEVLASGRPLTSYHAAALRDSVALDVPDAGPGDLETERSVADDPSSALLSPEPTWSAAAPAEAIAVRSDPDPVWAPSEERAADRSSGDLFGGDAEPASRPVAMRTWQSGRRRRAFAEPAEDARPADDLRDLPRESASEPESELAAGPRPDPVPLARRRPAPSPREAVPFVDPTPFAEPADPLVGPLDQPLLDPVLDTVGGPAGDPPPTRVDPAPDERRWAGEDAPGLPTAAPVAESGARAGESPLLKPESMARLNEADRHLLARLQAELEPDRPPTPTAPPRVRRSGAHTLRTADDEPSWTSEPG